MKGFTESGGGFEFAVGSVTGVRWWTIDQELMRNSLEDLLPEQSFLEPVRDPGFPVWGALPAVPRYTREHVYPCPLVGAWGPWAPGENVARCNRSNSFDPAKPSVHEPPDDNCMCGYWAYWDLADAPPGDWDVAGVIQGYGRSTIGPLGFRVQKAKIIALHLATAIEGCDERGGRLDDQTAAAKWQLDMEDMLAAHYGVRMWASLEAMAAAYPPNGDYATEEILVKSRERIANIRERNRHARNAAAKRDLDETAMHAARLFDEMIKRFKKEADENGKQDTDTDGAG